MRQHLVTTIPLAALAFGFATTAQAAPVLGGTSVASEAKSAVEKAWWRRICDEEGEHCRRVWIDEDRDDYRYRQIPWWRLLQGGESRREFEEREEHEEEEEHEHHDHD